jgi:hypothetical protein
MSGKGKLRVATAALSERIFAGYPLKSGLGFREPRHDVTSDVLKAVHDKIGIGHEIEVTCDGVVLFRIAVLAPIDAGQDAAPEKSA